MRLSYVVFGLLFGALAFAAIPASAACQVVSPDQYWDINYVTVCLLDEGSFTDTTQVVSHDYLVHARQAFELDPAFTFWEARVARGTWTYDDEDVHHQREWVQIGSGMFVGARGLVGTGYHFYLDQRDQTAGEDAAGYCSSVVGRSTCFGAGAWFTVQDVTSIGAAGYYHQVGTGADCREQGEVDADVLGIYEAFPTAEQACTSELPWLYDELPWDAAPRV